MGAFYGGAKCVGQAGIVNAFLLHLEKSRIFSRLRLGFQALTGLEPMRDGIGGSTRQRQKSARLTLDSAVQFKIDQSGTKLSCRGSNIT